MSRFERAVLRVLRAPDHWITVRAVTDVTPRYRRIRFHGPGLLAEHPTPPAFWLRLWFPAGEDEYQRGYTVTDVDRDGGAFSVEFVLHDGSALASDWARAAEEGDRLRATVYPGKPFAVPDPAPTGYLLVGDPASLPAINDILRALPEGTPARVLLQRQHAEDMDLPAAIREGDELTWVVEEDGLPKAVAALKGDLDGWHAWVATDTGTTKRVRTLLRDTCGLPKDAVTARGYWIKGRSMGGAPKGE
ncbi:siderophore-interacting protein [Nocardiopsis suaedae]|uniref:Siderophore-interacting protein n=1 Tax=Nocardiopsis suaedae TaxID=3018444 RepID=A0ABT4TG52_9ACTN|nr:siderophore-interacting protein [Nocardiopsis suaedae]MDA2803606.1 siderophore-interacting protein [Nocardiopsis suaedae]